MPGSRLPFFVVVSRYDILDGFSDYLTEVWSQVKVGSSLQTLVLEIKSCWMDVIHLKHAVHHALIVVFSMIAILLRVNLRVVHG